MRTASAAFRPAPLATALAFLLSAVSLLSATPPSWPDSVQYDAIWNGKTVGRMSYSLSEQPSGQGSLMRSRLSMSMSVRILLVVKVTVEGWTETLRNRDGNYSFYRQGTIRGHRITQKGWYDGRKLVCDTETDGKLKHEEFDDSLFDCTSLEMDSPAADLSPGQEKTVRVLNLESLKVRERTFRCLRYEDLCVAADTVSCKVIANKKGDTLEWITRDSLGVLIKQQEENPKAVSLHPTAVVWRK